MYNPDRPSIEAESSRIHKAFSGAVIGFAAAFVAAMIWWSGLLDKWDLNIWDFQVRTLAAPSDSTDEIVMILLDQNSLDWGASRMGLTWPWPRELYGAVVDFCRRTQVRSLSFDVLFSEPSPYGVSDDKKFSSAIGRYGKVALPAFFSKSSGMQTQWPKIVAGSDKITWTDPNRENTGAGRVPFFARAAFPIKEIAVQAAVICNVNDPPGFDGVHRDISVIGRFGKTIVPSLGMGAYLAAFPDEKGVLGPRGLSFGNRLIPIGNNGKTLVRYRGAANTFKTFSAAAVIQSEIQLKNGQEPVIKTVELFRDKYVFFGFSAPGLMDLRSTPTDPMNPGVGIHATVLDNFLSKDFIRSVPWPVSLILTLISAVFAGALISAFNRPLSAGLMITVLILAPVGAGSAAYIQGFRIPAAFMETALLLTTALVLLNTYITQGRQKRFIKNAFRQYLSPQVIDQILLHPEKLSLGGERRNLTVFFSDIRNFTSISERLEPEEVVRFLNLYLSEMTDVILEEGGTIDKYEGDAIMAFWNAPLKSDDHAVRCVRAALRCRDRLKQHRDMFKNLTGGDVSMGIGINTGPAVVGNMGSKKRFDYTAIGDTVNLASRLESANKEFGTTILISASTFEKLDSTFTGKKIGNIRVKGRIEPVMVFEPEFSKPQQSK